MNTHAFRVGRLLVADPEWAKTIRTHRVGAVEVERPALSPDLAALLAPLDGETLRLASIRVPELIEYQDRAYAQQYVDFVKQVWEAEQARASGRTGLSRAVARYLFKLMAYKDEYEVARLHLKASLAASLAAQYPGGARVHYHLHPPILRALGWTRKIKLGPWFDGVFRLLARMRGLRGTAFDPFGRARVRQVERELIGEYRALVEKALIGLGPETYERAVRLAELPDLIRGYEEVKLRNVERFHSEVRALGL
jgi:indolepyruvate ferredoxin oxidoreductase